MKRITTALMCLLMLATLLAPEMFSQERHRSKFGRKARTAAMLGGGAVVGGLIGGKKGAAIGAGGAGMYAFNRKAARRHFSGRTRTIGSTASGAALGAGVGGAVGHGRGAAAGAILGAGGGYLTKRHYARKRRY
ncbi:MAG: hypothetical protein QOF61_3198 [Acidobacteriota bacterium]|jgi:hypothetical protein|nr:hypothetical protein [Acidobacteriota bacterium]